MQQEIGKDLQGSFQDQIWKAVTEERSLQIVGGNSKSFYGNKAQGDPLNVSGHAGIIDYDPAELVITLRAGSKLSVVEALLAKEGQMFGFEPPHYSTEASIGGMVASGLAGPRRAYAGGIRDSILGVKVLDGHGNVLNFGGRVIKNVAGFDVSRLMVGTMGSLGVILEVSLHLIPQAETEVTLGFEHSTAEQHIHWINALSARPLPISASMWVDGHSQIRLSGSAQGVASAMQQLGGEVQQDEWLQIKEQRHAFFQCQEPLHRISIPAATDFPIEQAQLIEWGGAQRWFSGDCDVVRMRAQLAEKKGALCLFRGDSALESMPQSVDPAVLLLHRHLKLKFDPDGIFNPGRMALDL